MPGNVDLAPGVDLDEIALDGKKEGQFIYGVKPCVGQRNATTGNYDLLAVSTAYGCTEPYFLIREPFQRRTAMFRYDEFRRPSLWQLDVNFAKTTPITDKVRLPGASRGVQPLQQPDVRRAQTTTDDTTSADFGRINRNITRPVELPAVHPARIPADLLTPPWPGTASAVPGYSLPWLTSLVQLRLALLALAASLAVLTSAARRGTRARCSGTTSPPPLQQRLAAAGLAASTFEPAPRRPSRADDRACPRRATSTRPIYYALQSATFTALPPIEPALSARDVRRGLDDAGAPRYPGRRGRSPTGRIPAGGPRPARRARVVAAPPPLRSAGSPTSARSCTREQTTPAGACCAAEYVRAMRFLYQKEFVAQRDRRRVGGRGAVSAPRAEHRHGGRSRLCRPSRAGDAPGGRAGSGASAGC